MTKIIPLFPEKLAEIHSSSDEESRLEIQRPEEIAECGDASSVFPRATVSSQDEEQECLQIFLHSGSGMTPVPYQQLSAEEIHALQEAVLRIESHKSKSD